MKKYDEYKDSGVEWIGEVPRHWEVVHLKQVLKGIQDGTHGTFQNVESDNVLLSAKNVTDDGLNIGDNERTVSDKDYTEITSNGFPQNGDVLVCCVGTLGRCCIFDSLRPIAFQRSVTFLRVNGKLNNKALLFILRNLYIQIQFVLFAKTSAQSGVYMGDLKNFYIALPPLSEQQAIATYLDKKCSEIDKVISAQQKRIALLQELKQSVITHAVTKGLDTNVEMKDSGVEWIGEVPKHWKVMKTSLAFHGIGSGTTPSTSKSEFYDEEIGKYWLQTGDLNDGIITDTSKKVTDVAIKSCNLKFYSKDSVVIAMYGATIGKIGILGIEASTNQACCVLPANKNMSSKYSFYEFLACKPALLVSAIGGGQPNISQDTIKKLKIVVPALSEQQSIATYLDKKCASIDSSISKAQHQVALLQEYKQSLITEVVTGKRKVC